MRQMGDSPLYIVLGWDSSAAQAVKSLVSLGMKVTVVVPAIPEGVPSEARVVTGATFNIELLRAVGAHRIGKSTEIQRFSASMNQFARLTDIENRAASSGSYLQMRPLQKQIE